LINIILDLEQNKLEELHKKTNIDEIRPILSLIFTYVKLSTQIVAKSPSALIWEPIRPIDFLQQWGVFL